MNVSLLRSKRTIARLAGVLGLSSMLLVAVPAHAATTTPPGRIATNLPNVYAFPAPPAGFDPTRASTTDLRRYGFPLPPDRVKAPKAYQNWVNVMHHSRQYVRPSFKTRLGKKHATSSNWSGAATKSGVICFIICHPSATPIEVEGMWQVPDVSRSTQTSYSSTWVGLDGYGNSQVEQMGTEQDAFRFCIFTCNTISSDYAWFELYPDYETEVMNGLVPFLVRPGDYIYADISYDKGSNMLDFFLVNSTTGQYVDFYTPAKYGCPGLSAEWITERPTINGSLPALANFGHVAITGAYFTAVTWGGTYIYPAMSNVFIPSTINMVNGNGSTLAYGYAPQVDEIDSLWVNYS